jgi:hypothetical protein
MGTDGASNDQWERFMEPQAGGGATSTAIEYSEPYWSLRVAATVPVSCLDDTGRTDQQAKSPDRSIRSEWFVCLFVLVVSVWAVGVAGGVEELMGGQGAGAAGTAVTCSF